MNTKLLAFEYSVYQLHNWYKEVYGNSETNDLSTLKVLKLLFFISAVNSDKNTHNTLIDLIFNKFWAMPYGHVESEVYDFIKNGQIKNITLNNSSSSILNLDNILKLDLNSKNMIDKNIKLLKEINIDLIKYSSIDLVELSHRWYSWQKNYKIALSNNSFSHNIPIEDIKGEIKVYQY
ncbi:type II toxin-antitoxin system antitoxin SocA domain-containing protein [Flavobacterium covae]|uniref:type II toxin-antitoxin system antitoxin SocA domain-containing protein n=1 Tax=Flavobacterium covae TaxID=2906076 RepID=UPI000745C715|nr:type II toxin-antitoxin system antitoxin SocA domain-containing protein [Flavobacterium covae]AMA49983.1 hypothetical protein AWN65_11200 [Flavobacterium covae]MCJ1808603.1 Panacea domain-containing protein [Flavobacterium covae]